MKVAQNGYIYLIPILDSSLKDGLFVKLKTYYKIFNLFERSDRRRRVGRRQMRQRDLRRTQTSEWKRF
jgi:hypothetical protein